MMLSRNQDLALSALLAALAGTALTGCFAVEEAVTTASASDYTADLLVTHDKVVAATRKTLTDLRYKDVKENTDGPFTLFDASTEGGGKVFIRVRNLPEKTTRVLVRHGSFGDRPLSAVFVQEIKKRL